MRRWIFQATCNDATGSRFVGFFDNEAVQVRSSRIAAQQACCFVCICACGGPSSAEACVVLFGMDLR